MTLDEQIRKDFFEVAAKVGCTGQIGDFVTAINDGGNEYPLFLLTPITSRVAANEEHESSVGITAYFFELYQGADGQAPTEAELWQLWGKAADRAKAFKNLLLQMPYISKYAIEGNYTIERNAFSLGVDETVFVKANFNMRVYESC